MEVLGVDDLKLLVETGSVNWGSTAEGEDLPLVWALKNKEEVVEALAEVNKMNLEGDPSSDLAGEKKKMLEKVRSVNRWVKNFNRRETGVQFDIGNEM